MRVMVEIKVVGKTDGNGGIIPFFIFLFDGPEAAVTTTGTYYSYGISTRKRH